MQVLRETTNYYQRTSEGFGAMDLNYLQKHMPAIVSFTIEVSDLQHVCKLSQNRSEQDQEAIIAQLDKGDEMARMVAKEMKLRKPI
jgi:transcriptional regulator